MKIIAEQIPLSELRQMSKKGFGNLPKLAEIAGIVLDKE